MSGMSLDRAISSDAGLMVLRFLQSNNGAILISTIMQFAWLFKARDISQSSRDPSSKVGAVIVHNDDLLTHGYNHFPNEDSLHRERLADMFANRDYKLKNIIHAELDAINQVSIEDRVKLADATMFIYPCLPCTDCAQAIVAAGIRKLVAPVHTNCTEACMGCKGTNFSRWQPSFIDAKALFESNGVSLIEIPIRDLALRFPTVAPLVPASLPEVIAVTSETIAALNETVESDSEDEYRKRAEISGGHTVSARVKRPKPS